MTWLTAGWVRCRRDGGAGKTALLGDGEKGFELVEFHVRSFGAQRIR